MKISLIATVLNEGESIRFLMDSIVKQTRQPEEVLICDGGSSDETITVLESYSDKLPLTIISRPGANISEGRNAAIEAASHDLIAVTDAGVRLAPNWLESLISPFNNTLSPEVVGGFFLPDADTPFEVAMGATVLPEVEDISAKTFMPSSRSIAFTKASWAAVGGYPEWLDFCEDLVFDFRLNATTSPFGFAPKAVVYFRPRSTLKAFFKQYYLYARGDGKANLFPRRHLIRYLTYLIALPLLFFLGSRGSLLWFGILLAGGIYMVFVPYRRLSRQWGELSFLGRLESVFWVPIIRVGGDIAKMFGYPAGWLWRLKNTPPDWHIK